MRFIWTGRIAREIYHLPQNLSSLYCCLGVAHCRNYFAHCTCQLGLLRKLRQQVWRGRGWVSDEVVGARQRQRCGEMMSSSSEERVSTPHESFTTSGKQTSNNPPTCRTSWVDVWKDLKPRWLNFWTSPSSIREKFFIHCRRWQCFLHADCNHTLYVLNLHYVKNFMIYFHIHTPELHPGTRELLFVYNSLATYFCAVDENENESRLTGKSAFVGAH